MSSILIYCCWSENFGSWFEQDKEEQQLGAKAFEPVSGTFYFTPNSPFVPLFMCENTKKICCSLLMNIFLREFCYCKLKHIYLDRLYMYNTNSVSVIYLMTLIIAERVRGSWRCCSRSYFPSCRRTAPIWC